MRLRLRLRIGRISVLLWVQGVIFCVLLLYVVHFVSFFELRLISCMLLKPMAYQLVFVPYISNHRLFIDIAISSKNMLLPYPDSSISLRSQDAWSVTLNSCKRFSGTNSEIFYVILEQHCRRGQKERFSLPSKPLHSFQNRLRQILPFNRSGETSAE